ncbi:MAG TPA: proline racemase family protein, partial [Dongiaceae bacterium]|nr:proline racemase family protein [Dongiaceae bacterium]
MHSGGEPVRIVVSGYPPIPGATILAKRRYAREHLDRYRRLLMFEPRGHFDMYGVIPVEPDLADADLAVLFMHNEGYSTMCGHAVIALARWAVDSGRVAARAPETPVAIQCPCGLVRTRVAIEDGRAGAARFESVPAFAFALDATIELSGRGRVELDIGYGGAFYALVPASI